ncbi:MAG: hypothetical protein U9N82_10265 [Thermodesulfobacteriota bacterium]|nr:hypothetical protein [Thermodesulfobacteriota bacterium]
MPKVMELPTHIWFQISNMENPALRGTEIKQPKKLNGGSTFCSRKAAKLAKKNNEMNLPKNLCVFA